MNIATIGLGLVIASPAYPGLAFIGAALILIGAGRVPKPF
jgi:hypothetical protein